MKRPVASLLAALVLGTAGLVLVLESRAEDKPVPAWRKLRPDAPDEPATEPYKWDGPKDGWAPPATVADVEKTFGPWTDGPIKDAMEIGRERAAKIKPLCTVAEALKLRNDSTENNAKIVSALCQYPASPDEVDWDATLNRHSASPTILNPLFGSSTYETWMMSLLAPGLTGADHELSTFADREAVKAWHRSPLADWIEMRDDMTWEDGTPFTAYDVEFSWHVDLDPRVPIPARTAAESLRWVKAYGPTTIVFFHKEQLATNAKNIGFSIVPKHVYERGLTEDPTMRASKWNNYWNRNPLSGGSYVLKEWATAQHLLFERRESAYVVGGKQVRSKPYFKQVRFRIIDDPNAALLALKKGELDDLTLTAPQWTRQTSDDDFYKYATKVRGASWMYGYIGWNMKPIPDRPFFKDKRVRRALGLALDHDELLKKVLGNLYEPCVGPFHPDSPWGSREQKPMKQNLDEAEKLLDEAGWTLKDGVREKDGVKFEFTMSVPTGGTGALIAEFYKQNLKDIGITMNIKMLEWATYQSLTQEHKFEANVAAWGTGGDPDYSKNVWMTEQYEKGRNYVGYANPRVDELFEKGVRELDHEKRRKIYQEISRLIYEDQPYLFINYRATFWAYSKDVRGYNFSPRDMFSYSPGFASIWKPRKKAS